MEGETGSQPVVKSRQVDVQPKPAEATRANEFTFQRRPDLQASLLGISQGKFPDRPLTKEEIGVKLNEDVSKRWNWKLLNEVSLQERINNSAKSVAEWKASFTEWITIKADGSEYGKSLKTVLQALGIKGDKITDQDLQTVLDRFCYGEETQSRMDTFVKTIAENLPDYGSKTTQIHDVAEWLFGQEVASTIVSQIVDLEDQIKQTGGKSDEIGKLAEALGEAAKTPTAETKEVMEKTKALHEKYKAGHPEPKPEDKDKGGTPGTGLAEKVKIDGQPLPDKTGGAIIGNRGKMEAGGDTRGQDRIFYDNLSNGVEVFADLDGAGTQGHQVAEWFATQASQKLAALTPADISEAKLEEIAKALHTEAQQKFDKSCTCVEMILRLPGATTEAKKERYLMHIGEGFAGTIGETSIDKLIEPQNLGTKEVPQQDGSTRTEAIRSPKGFKTPALGADTEIKPEIKKLDPEKPVILASDGFGELLNDYKIDYAQLHKLLQEDPQKAAEYLAQIANQRLRKYCDEWNKAHTDKKDPDDISILIILP